MSAQKFSFLLLLAAAILTLFWGCQKGDQGPQGPSGQDRIYVSAYAGKWGYSIPPVPAPIYYTAVDIGVTVTDAPSIPSLWVNNLACPLDMGMSWPGTFAFNFSDTGSLAQADSLFLKISFLKSDGSTGLAQAAVATPDTFRILSPTGWDILLPVGSDLAITWSSSARAQNYNLHLHLDYTFFDTLNLFHYHRFSLDTLVVDTSVIFSAQTLFPNLGVMHPDSAVNGEGHLQLNALNGPCLPGALGNVSGDGEGFFLATTTGGYLSLTVQSANLVAQNR